MLFYRVAKELVEGVSYCDPVSLQFLRSWLKELVTVLLFNRVPEELVEGVS